MQTKKQTYIVTGAAGFIGSHLCQALLNKTNTQSVIGIDTINDYYRIAIKNRRIKILSENKRFSFYKISVLDKEMMTAIAMKHKPTVLIHTAAAVGVRNGEGNPVEYFSTNTIGTLTTLEATATFIQQAVVFSSSSVYGSTQHLPFQESEPITISTPVSVYGASKAAMEIAVHNFYKRTGIPITIVRPFSIYGPDGRPDMFPIKILISAVKRTPLTVYSATTSSRDWTYIDDCVDMIMTLLHAPKDLQTVNIGNGHPVRLDHVIAIARSVINAYNYSIQSIDKPANLVEIKNTWADTTTIKKIYTNLTTSFDQGFIKTADFFFKHVNLYV